MGSFGAEYQALKRRRDEQASKGKTATAVQSAGSSFAQRYLALRKEREGSPQGLSLLSLPGTHQLTGARQAGGQDQPDYQKTVQPLDLPRGPAYGRA